MFKPNLTNWFELKAAWIAEWTPRHAIEGYFLGADANGLIIEAAQWHRALVIQDTRAAR
ncbi:hypothetical protein AB0I81_40040 [Nonomuraea sp. NPDC050404]|uniref:hypothetical protein n=1 Tax=Nonomuraea sp. NPDC050404 TaxID=3155783 RepID=UPI0033DC3CEC